jgi:GNAT superfamily N-acetyltransferase
MVTIRDATQQNQAAIKALIKETGINPFGIKWQRFLVAVDEDDVLLGCGQVKVHRDGARELASIAVKAGWRGQGIARLLIEGLLDQHGCPLWLTCRSILVPFYSKFHFVEATDPTQMPRYFQIIRWFSELIRRIIRSELSLAVMVCHSVS